MIARVFPRKTNASPTDAADLIERLSAESADLRKELEWKDMVIALAQRKQAEAEAEKVMKGETEK